MEDPKRQLNMEEKKDLQRLLFSDITTASTKYKAARDKEREQLQKHLIEKAPPALRALLAQRKTARDTQSRLEKQLNESGYAIDTCRRGKTGRPPIAPELRTLIRRMTMENRVWGQRRIQAELARLGFAIRTDGQCGCRATANSWSSGGRLPGVRMRTPSRSPPLSSIWQNRR